MKKHFLLSLLLIVCLYLSLASPVCGAEETVQEKGLTILNDVVGFDVAKYSTTSKQYSQDSFVGGLPQQMFCYTLRSNGSEINTVTTFVNEKLQRIHVFEDEDSSQTKKPNTNALEMAETFLDNYRDYTKNSFYEELKSTLTAVDPNRNSTTVVANKKIEVTSSADSTTFKWTYTFNGIDAPDKCVAIRYKNGALKYFIDNWDLYKIGSTDVNLSETEAVDIAVKKAKTLIWMKTDSENGTTDLKYTVTGGMVWETIFAPSVYMDEARSEDLLELYPMRHIWISFDNFYPGNVYGANVYVWADTGEIGFVKERFSTIDPPDDLVELLNGAASKDESTEVQSNSSLFTWILLPLVAVTLLGSVPFYLSKKKKIVHFKLSRLHFFKTKGILVCLLLFSTVVFTISTSIANATPLNGRATIWGSESYGAFNTTLWSGGVQGTSWRKTNPEVWQQQETAQFIRNQFANNGYSASNYQGSSGSYKSTILSQIGNNEVNYPRVAVVNFDHGNGQGNIPNLNPTEFHYMFEDHLGTYGGDCNETKGPVLYDNLVFDMDIYDETTLGKTFFVFINTCNSAHVGDTFGNWTSTQGLVGGSRARGMPFAWTHLNVTASPTSSPPSGWMSCNGYSHPDYTSFCYMGFLGGSAALNQTVGAYSVPYHYWIEHFFAFALTDSIPIKDALDDASQAFFYDDFDGTELYTGFSSIWPMNYEGQWQDYSGAGWLKVYGNSYQRLYQPLLTLNAYDNYSNQIYPTFYVDGESHGTGSVRILPKVHSVNVGDVAGYTFSHFSYGGGTYGRPAGIQVIDDGTITAHFNVAPTYYTLSISTSGSGYTSPSGSPQYQSGTYATVYAYPNQDWLFDHWVLDSQYAGSSSSINVYMNTNHNLQAVFVEDQPPPQYYYVTIEAWGYYPPWTLMYQGSQYMQEGPQQFSAPSSYGGLPFYAWYHNGNYYYDLTIWLSIYSDTYLAALYSY